MGKVGTARRVASAAAVGGGGLTALGAGLYGVLKAEATLARRAIGTTDDRVPDSTGWYGRSRPAPAIRIALLGDSSAAGYGVRTVEETPGAWLGSVVSERANRRVHLREFCKVGAQSSDLAGQVDAALPTNPDVAVILVGANDVTHTVLPAASVGHLSGVVRRLRGAGVSVVVGTCPDLGTITPIPQPLRHVARYWSRRLAAQQTVAVVEAGGRTVSLASVLGPEFAAAPALHFGPDKFHPSAAGYAALARVLVPSVLSALGFQGTDEESPRPTRGEAVMSIGDAAARASRNPGTEIEGTEVAGAKRGIGGRWVTLMRRRLLPLDAAAGPEPAPAATEEPAKETARGSGGDDAAPPGGPDGAA